MIKDEWLARELSRNFTKAGKVGRRLARDEPRAEEVRYLRRRDRLEVTLRSGAVLTVPMRLIPDLKHATAAQLGRVSVSAQGHGLRWEELDIDLSVPALVASLLDSATWMAELGRRGGSVASRAKQEAARRNGALGGRPRKIRAAGE